MSLFRNVVPRESKCYTCRHSHIIRGFAESDELVYCDFGYPMRVVPFPVRECTNYGNRNESNLEDMRDIAIPLVWRKGEVAGFARFLEAAPKKNDDESE